MKTDKEFEDFFRDRFKDFEESPPDDAWENIQPQIRKPKFPRSKIVGMLGIFVVAVLIPMGLFVYKTEQNNYSKKERIDKTVTIHNKPSHEHLNNASSGNDSSKYSSNSKGLLAEESQIETNKSVQEEDGKVDSRVEKDMGNRTSTVLGLPEKGVKENNLTSSAVSDSFRRDKKEAIKDVAGLVEEKREKRNKKQKQYLATESLNSNATGKFKDLNVEDKLVNVPGLSYDSSKLSSAVSDSFLGNKKEANKGVAGLVDDKSKKSNKKRKQYLATESVKKNFAGKSRDLNSGNKGINVPGLSSDSSKLTSVSKPQKEISNSIMASNKSKPAGQEERVDRPENLLENISSLGIKNTNGLTNINLQFAPDASSFIVKKEKPSIAVENKKAKNFQPAKKYDLQIFFSPRYSYRRVTLNKGDEVYVQNVSGNRYFGERLGYEMGLVGSKSVTERLRLNLGLSFVNLNEKLTYNSTEGGVGTLKIEEINPNEFNISPVYKSDTITFKSVYYYTGLTVSTSYIYATSGKGTFYVTVGGGVNLLVKGTTEKKINGVNQSKVYFPSKKSPLEQMNFKLNFGPGYAYKISSKTEFLIEPTINYYLGSTYKKREPLGLRPYTIGLNLGLRF